MPNLYCTLNEFARYKRMRGASQPDPAKLLEDHERSDVLAALQDASRKVDTICGRFFYPLLARYYFDHADGQEIKFGNHDLLRADTVYTANGTDTVPSGEYYLYSGDDHNFTVKNRLVIKRESGYALYVSTGLQQANSISGVWGYHELWGDAWLDSLDTVKTELTSSATTLEVNKVGGVNGDGITPRFQIGQLLQIDDEWLYVADVDESDNTLSVARAQNGSTAAIHEVSATIYIYNPMRDIVRATRIIADYFRNIPNAPFGTVQAMDSKFPMRLAIPDTAMELLQPFIRQYVGYAATGGFAGLEYADVDPAFWPSIGTPSR